MSQPPILDLSGALKTLTNNADALSWPARRDLARGISEELQKAPPSEHTLALVRLLANDPKGEVRCEIAELLVWLPPDEFLQISSRLSKDDHAFVIRATARAMSRRRKGAHEAERQREGLDLIESDYRDMAKIHGPLAADKARKMADRLYDLLVGTTAHNLRGIVTPVKLNVLTLRRRIKAGKTESHAMFQILTKIEQRMALLERSINNMRAFARLPSPERRPERVVALVQEAVGMAGEAAKTAGKKPRKVKVQVDVPEHLVVHAGKDAIVVAILNIVGNAHDAFSGIRDKARRPQITISARATSEDRVEISIADNGCGIDAEKLAEVRMFRPGKISIQKSNGTGLGLPIARRYIVANGGSLEIASEENNGTTVIISLPATNGDEDRE